MDAREFFERALQLESEGRPFALATVVVRRSPVSSHLGDRAVVLADGTMEGYVGGACSREIVVDQALDAMRTGRSRLLQIRSEEPADAPLPDESERVVIPMGCASEGAVDVYVEPHLPRSLLLVAGETPVAHEVARIGALLERFRVVHARSERDVRAALQGLDDGERAALCAVVATQGIFDEAALEAVLTGVAPAYAGLLASRKRAANVLGVLAQQGVAAERLANVKAPAGLDLGARRPSEVAISILAEIVAGTCARVPGSTEP
ncbi:MAG: XdhC family protein [Candidatus Baltobacteraceae bacterium]